VSIQQKDIFICHASEDKPDVVRPLYEKLESEGFNIWYDEAEIKWGDSITERVNWGLIHSKYVVVVLSESFLEKRWPNREFNSVVNTESSSGVVKVLPLVVGDGVIERKIIEAYPLINDKRYLKWSNNQTEIVEELYKIFPEKSKRNFETDAKKINQKNFSDQDVLCRSNVSVNVQKVSCLSGNDEGLFITPNAVNGIPFSSVLNSLIENDKGETLLVKYLDKAVWKKIGMPNDSGQKLFIEIPYLYHKTLFVPQFLTALTRDVEISPGNLVILLPETVITYNHEGIYRTAASLRDLGFSIGISQFGTGYSSLSYIQRLNFSYLFIDRSFSKGAGYESDEYTILRAICSLTDSLNIVSGIDCAEHKTEIDLLKSVGCQLMASPVDS
jgi:EAL domain-containing protein (putative c-di-GMP-specific phosphodiesterase class I)